jgi:uncharacterized membrane protein YccF (DUF307 family)
MKTFGNILWFILFGLVSGLLLFVTGLVFCVTLIGIPFGIKCFKLAGLAFWPFGKTVGGNFEAHPVGNALWIAFYGFSVAAIYTLIGAVLCVTIIGIPFAKQCFKIARYCIRPFGATID